MHQNRYKTQKSDKLSSFFYGQVGVLVLAFLLRLIHLNGSFWLDEAAQALESIRPLSQQTDILGDFQPPLMHFLTHFWMFGGTSEWWLRLVSLIPGLITIWLTMQVGKKIVNEHTGLIAGILLATSQFHLFYSQELRPYSLATMWTMVVIFCFYHLDKYPRKAAAGFVIGGVAGMYSMYVFPLFLIAILILTAIRYRHLLRKVTALLAVVALGFAPWISTFIKQYTVGTGLTATFPAWSQMVSPPLLKMLPLTAVKFFYGRINVDATLPYYIFFAACVFLIFSVSQKTIKTPKWIDLVIWFAAPILLAFIISIKVPVLDPKRVMFCLPALYLFLASGIGRGIKSILILSLLLSLNMYSVTQYANNPDEQREPWREAVAQVESIASPNDVIIFDFPDGLAPWAWYQRRNFEIAAIPKEGTLNNYIDRRNSAIPVDQYIVFDYLMDMTDPGHTIFTKLNQLGYFEVNYVQYPNIGKIRFFQPIQPIALVANP